jgi:hypothetical protein
MAVICGFGYFRLLFCIIKSRPKILHYVLAFPFGFSGKG